MANTGFDVFQGRLGKKSGKVREGTRDEIASIEIREGATNDSEVALRLLTFLQIY